MIPGIDDRVYRKRAQAQFEGVIDKYPLRTFGHPPVEDIFSSSYRVVGRHAKD